MTRRTPEPPEGETVTRKRAAELLDVVTDEAAVLGPLDRRDLELLMHELYEWRTGERVFSIEACKAGREGITLKGHVVQIPRAETA